jgi:hypothetical protein
MFKFTARERAERGQVLVIVALSLVVIVAMVGLVIDGGFAWGQQRRTQNGADSMSEAGAAVLAMNLAGTTPVKTDGDVGCAVEQAAAANGIANPEAFYTDIEGYFLTPSVQVGPCAPGGGAAVPTAAEGVKATGERTFDTFLARVIGFNQFGCAILPVTFPLTAIICDGTHQQIQIGTAPWPLVQADDPAAPNYATSANEVIIPLCTTENGSVGWLDLGCGNLAETITTPCNASIPIPAWVHTQTGNVNALEDELNDFGGGVVGTADDSVVLFPIHDNTCSGQPADDDPTCDPIDAEGSGDGENLYYHVPKFAAFMLDQVYVGGNDQECLEPPGAPVMPSHTTGFVGCFKGWFVRYVLEGPVRSGASGPQDPGVIGLQLIQ